MKVLFILLASLCIGTLQLIGQTSNIISGKVQDASGGLLPGAVIRVHPAKLVFSTDTEGDYKFSLPAAKDYRIVFSYLGYQSLEVQLHLTADTMLKIELPVAMQNLQEVEIHDHYAESKRREQPLSVEIAGEAFLQQFRAGSLMQSLERLPGVDAITIGSGQSKPVIRGLSFNRVVVTENGIRHEAQQWGQDHGLEIDQFAIDRAEVIKGPASLMLGSDAIGGVIQLKHEVIPEENSSGGSIELSAQTNNDLAGLSGMAYTRKKSAYLSLRATLVRFADYRVPVDSINVFGYRVALPDNRLRNTAGKEQNFHADFGWVKNDWVSRFFVSRVAMQSGFFANAHGLEPRRVDTALHDKSLRDIQLPRQDVVHWKVVNNTAWMINDMHIEIEAAWQRNLRDEWSPYTDHGFMPPLFPDSMDFPADLERSFDKQMGTVNTKFSWYLGQELHVHLGTNTSFQDNSIGGRGFIFPAYHQWDAGIFAYTRYRLSGAAMLHFGMRYDAAWLETETYQDWFPSPASSGVFLERATALDRFFGNLTWSAGLNYNLEHTTFKINIGKGFRVPLAKELAANGVNYHHFSFERGNADLDAEQSYQLDAGVEYTARRFAIGITPFINYFTNYIYLNPGFEHDWLYGNGNQVYDYTQAEVLRWGAELHAHYDLSESWMLGLMGEYLYAEQLSGAKKGFGLPFAPPANALLHLKYRPQHVLQQYNPVVTLDFKWAAPQNRIVPPEEKTTGYQTLSFSTAFDIPFKKQTLSAVLKVNNLLNTTYYNHMSYYRIIGIPEPGRSLSFSVKLKF